MKVIFNFRKEKVLIEFNHNITTYKQVNNLKDLYFLKEIESAIKTKFLGTLNGHFYMRPGIKSTSVDLFEEADFNKIKTSIRRDYIINNILNEND